jgi:type 1 glutamine amidotransferase
MAQPGRSALVVRGGWDGHSPVEATERFLPFLEDNGFTVDVRDSLDCYDDEGVLAASDLILQCWTQGEITEARAMRVAAAVAAGTGLAGWHGGIVDAFRFSPEWLQLTGGQFATHPGGIKDHEIEIVPERAGHEIVADVEPRWAQHTEQYWSLTDGLNDVLAISRFRPGPDTPWREELVAPAVWTRVWGRGRVFVSTIGHYPSDLDVPPVRTLTERGLLWAARAEQPATTQ